MSDKQPNTVDKNSFRYIFTENLYFIGEKQEKAGQKETIIAVKDAAEYASHKELLIKILQAVNLDIENCQVVFSENIKSATPQYSTLLSFGISPDDLKLDAKLSGAVKKDGKNYLFTFPLAEIETNKEKKKTLWADLQKLFKQ
ncbi:MAG: DNA polymerase III subunit psi [Cytophagaceae bacterium]|nr:DNA polymerase III subunit psi [Cytophagaceae bacterium]